MKELILVRHAKSSWKDDTLKDFDRPLNKRGKTDAPAIAAKIAERKDIHPDLFICSSAKRTKETCQFFAKQFNIDSNRIIYSDELYEIKKKHFYSFIKKVKDQYKTIFIFGHNTLLTEFINEQTSVHIDNLPTCGVYAIKIETDSWKDYEKAEKKFWFLEYPKLY